MNWELNDIKEILLILLGLVVVCGYEENVLIFEAI